MLICEVTRMAQQRSNRQRVESKKNARRWFPELEYARTSEERSGTEQQRAAAEAASALAMVERCTSCTVR